MFIRTLERENGKVTIIIVESVREDGRVKHRTVRTVATVLPKEVAQFVELAQHIKSEMEHERQPKLFPVKTLAEMLIISRKRSIEEDPPLPVNMNKMREESRIVTGIHEIYGSLYDETGVSKVFKGCPDFCWH